MKTLLDNQFRFHQSALNVQAYRQQLLSSNIANADTPHFKARDIDFRSVLGKVLSGARMDGSSALALSTTQTGHIEGGAVDPLMGATLYRTELQSSVDGNTVNMDVERAAFTENSVHYEASLTFINGLVRSMQTAINGQ